MSEEIKPYVHSSYTSDPGLDIMTLGNILARSGYFAEAKDAAQAVVRVLAGRELGLQPIQSMVGIHIIQGRPVVGAATLAGLVRRSGRYDYQVKHLDETRCEIEFFTRGKDGLRTLGISSFTIEDARKAGSKNLERFPRNMLFARAISNGVRWYCPDLFMSPVYTPDEIPGAEHIDLDTGEVLTGVAQPVTAQEPVSEPEPEPAPEEAAEVAPPQKTRQALTPEKLKSFMAAKIASYRKKLGDDLASIAERDELMASLINIWPGHSDAEGKALQLLAVLTNNSEPKLLLKAEVQALHDWLKSGKVVREEAAALLAWEG